MEIVSPSQPLRHPFPTSKGPYVSFIGPHLSALPVIPKVHFCLFPLPVTSGPRPPDVTSCTCALELIPLNPLKNNKPRTHSIVFQCNILVYVKKVVLILFNLTQNIILVFIFVPLYSATNYRIWYSI